MNLVNEKISTSEKTEQQLQELVLEEEQGVKVLKLEDQLLRCRADLDNYRKRMSREKEQAILYANKDFLENLLPIVDNFELGLQTLETPQVNISSITQGISMIYHQLLEFIKANNLNVISSDPGTIFNPTEHQAVSQICSDTIPENHIIQTTRKGYTLQGRVIRAANVIVSSGIDQKE